MSSSDRSVLARLRAIVGEQHVLTATADVARYAADWRGAYQGRPLAVVRPNTTGEVAAVVRECSSSGVGIVPQGGNTGMCGGATPSREGNEVVVSLERMRRIVNIDPIDNTMCVEAGCVLAAIQEAARNVGRAFPLSLAAEGTAQIGGNLSTNAGGVNVLRYGNARDLVLGLEVVLPDGSVLDLLRALRKDNRGYDLKQLFVGAEGTLGIVTAAVLKLFPAPRERVTALLGMRNPDDAVEFLTRLRDGCGETVTAYELMSAICVDLVRQHIPGVRSPMSETHAWYVLCTVESMLRGHALRESVEEIATAAMEAGVVADAVLAASDSQDAELWRLRETLPEAIRAEGPGFRSDVAVPVSRIPTFIEAASGAVLTEDAQLRIVCFGHVGDGNLHFNVLPASHEAISGIQWHSDVAQRLYDVVADFGGSFSAEHGIGQAKRNELARYKSATELEMMRAIKQLLDPQGIMNPGKIF